MTFDKEWFKDSLVEPFVSTIVESLSDDLNKALLLIDCAKKRNVDEDLFEDIYGSFDPVNYGAFKGISDIYAGKMDLKRLFGHNAPSIKELHQIVDEMVNDIVCSFYHEFPCEKIKELFKLYAVRYYDRQKHNESFAIYEQLKTFIGMLKLEQCEPEPSIYENHVKRGNFSKLDFSYMTFEHNCFNGLYLKQANFSNSVYIGDGTTATCIHAHFEEANLSNFVFAGDFEQGVCIKTSCFLNAKLCNANLTGICNWTGCGFQGADFRDAFIIKEGKKITGHLLRDHLEKTASHH